MKFDLTDEEKECLNEVDFWKLSRTVNNKLEGFLYNLQAEYEQILKTSQPLNIQGLSTNHKKISKGNNYKGLPYLVLDYPSIFDRENILTIRTMIWWGNFISINLLIKGSFLKNLKSTIKSKNNFLSQKKLYFCVDASPWNHDFSPGSYISHELLTEDIFENHSINFIKLGKFCNVSDIDQWQEFCLTNFKHLIYTLK
ncbi:hypothetical protein [Marinigracilibium pacificum]|uniref:Uncharacterized protein n=1 Tax=Marinigracilibium pacificum TaxID=2729599 RepID=A0A848IY91_9BACT|nr:hypothetical protein [Marinigracilibium pacificum]NMM49257.1 hypothetical protein [Marinigracilibium pacificum]